jgi:Undecaprenyl-phosphate galactose phosphotransferase WbaP
MQGRAIYNFYLAAPQRGLRPVGIVDQANKPLEQNGVLKVLDLPAEQPSSIPYLGPVTQLSRIARRYSARWGIVAPGGCDGMDMLQVTNYAGALPHVVILPSQFSLPSLWSCPCECAGVMGIRIRDHLQSTSARFVKRASDIIGALLGLTLMLPLFLLAALWIKLRSPGPVLYGQRRIGRHGVAFTAWKFRTMVVNADEVLESVLENDADMRQQWMIFQKLKNDPRIIPGVGSFLRKTSLDEVPQLWNILKGEMSLVGPRPCMRSQVDLYQQMYPLYTRVRPGLTGLWQISGRNETSYQQRVRLDSYYVCNWSLWLDLYIIIRTIRTLLMREGAY